MSKTNCMAPGGGGRDWHAYDAAQINEKSLFLGISYELSKEVEEREHTVGRTPSSLRDLTLSLLLKVYSGKSGRRFMDDLRDPRVLGLIKAAPSPTTLAAYMRSESMTSVLQHLLVKSSLPLSEVESVFAADSTGFGVPGYRSWFNKHTGRRERRRDYVKLHAMVGVRMNIITYAEVSEGSASDHAHFKRLVQGTARHFAISEVSADAGYLSGESMHTVLLHGGIPYIAFRKNCALDADYKSTLWKDLLFLWKTRHPLFTEHYFLRNNVEASFHALKAKFGGRLRSKSARGQINEALAKAICHNICVLIRSMGELGIDPLAWSEKMPRPQAEGITVVEAMSHRGEDLLKIRTAAGDRQLPPEKERPKRSRRAKGRKAINHGPGQVLLFEYLK